MPTITSSLNMFSASVDRWFSLYDDPPRPGGDEVNRGLIDRLGRKKPAYFTFKRG